MAKLLTDEEFFSAPKLMTDEEFFGDSRPNAFMRGFMGTLRRDNPQTLAATAEGLGRLAGYEGANEIASDLRSLASRAPQDLARQVPTLDDIKGNGVLDTASRALTYAGEAVGSGLGSTVPAIATGIAGGLAGRRAAGRTGAVVGGLAGAAVPSAALNYGDLYEAIKDEGVDPQKAAELAAYGVGPITGLDVIGVEGAASRIIGAGARDAAIRGIAKRIVQEAKKGVAREGLTEAAQQVIQEAIAGTASGSDLLTVERGKRVLESGVQGALTGGAMGGASGIRSDASLQQQQTGPVVGEAAPPLVALPPIDRTRGDSFITRSPEEAAARQAEADLLQRDIARMEKRVQGLILQAESSTDSAERSSLTADIRQANRDLADARIRYGQLAAPSAATSGAETGSITSPPAPSAAAVSQPEATSPSAQMEPLYDEAGQQIGRWNPATGKVIQDGAQTQTLSFPAEPPPAKVTPADLASPLPTRDISEGKAIISELLGEAKQQPAVADQVPTAAPALAPVIGQESPGQASVVPVRTLENERPDPVEAAARRIDPRSFGEYDRLATQAETYRQWLADMQAQKMRNIQVGTESPQAIRDLQAEIDKTQARIDTATPRMKKKLNQRIEGMTARRNELMQAFDAERTSFIESTRPQDTSDMARVRQALVKTDAQMRDMASAMAAARSQARVTLGIDPAPAPAPTPPVPATTGRARARSIEPADAAAPAPIMRTDGTPYGSEKSAAMSARQRPDLKGRDLEPVKVKGGWGLRERGQSPDRVGVPAATAAAALPPAPAAQKLRIADRQEALPATLPAPTTASIIAVPAELRRNVAQAQQEAAQAMPAPASPIAPAATPTPAPAERSPAPAQVEPPAAVASPPPGASSPEASASAEADPIAFRASMAKPQATVAALDPVTRQAAIADFVRKVQSEAAGEASIDLGPTTIADRIKSETGIDVAGFTHVLDRSGIRHAIKQHGDPKREAARGQVPVTEADFAKLPDVLANPDTIENAGKTKQGRDAIRYSKAIGDQIFYVEEVRTGRKRLAPVTMYKRPIEGGRAATPDAPQPAAPAASPAQTPKTFRGPADNMAQVEAEGNQPASATTAPMPAPSVALNDQGQTVREGNPQSRQDELFAIAPQVTDSFAAAAAEIERNLKTRLERLGLSDRVGLRVTDMIRSLVSGQDMPGAVGMFSNTDTQKLIQVSVAAPSPGAILHHEALHAMRGMGLFSPREWQVLERAALADRERAARIERAYASQIEGMSAVERADLLTEETIADMYGDWSDGRLQARGALETLFQRIRNFLRALRNALAGAGFRTERDIFQAMDRGEIGSRQELPPMEPAERTQADNDRGPVQDQQGGAETTSTPKALEGSTVEPAIRQNGDKGGSKERMAISSAANRTGLPPGLDLSTPRRSVVEVLNDSSLPILQRLKDGGSREAIAEQVDRWRRVLQDQFLPVLRTQAKVEAATGRKLDVSSDPYLQQELSTGRIGARLEDLTEQHVRPLYEDLHAAGVSIQDLEAYLYARHAPERNARISSINPKFQPGEGSGMTDADAAAIMRGVRASGKQAAYEVAAKRVDAILNMALETRVEAGLLSRQEADAWKATYKHYVPLRGKAELDPDVNADRPNKGGSGITVKGKESYRAFGRETKAADILGYSIMQAEEAIIRAETNEVAKAFYKLAKDNPDAGLWQADKVEMRPVLDKASGQVRYQRASQISAEDKDYTVTAKIDGKEYRVTMNRENPVAVRLATAMRNLDGAQFGAWVRTVGSINRYLSTVNTTLNPEFIVVNAFRDLQTAGINLQQFDIPKMTRNTLRDYPAAMRASIKGNFGKRDSNEWSKWYQEYRASGAPVSFNRMDDINTIRSRISADFAAAGPGLSARKAWRGVWGTIENLNMGVEQAVRLAAYKNARQAGMSVERAASLAKNMTVNFNRKGSAGPIINSLYLFYNAGVQGTAALLSAAKSPRVRKVLYGAVLAGAVLEMYNQMAGDDDDDGESFYRKISENDKQRNLIVMLPGQGGNHLKIPLPYGYNVFFTLGRLGIATATGEKNAARAGTDLLTAVMDSFNPIGGSGSLLNIIAPTIADPVVDLTRNRDYADRPIAPEPSPYTTPEPDSSTYWNNVSTPSKAFTAWLNEATGGDDVRPGAIDISPETLDYMAGFATGAAGSFFGRITNLGAKLLDPQGEVTANDLPLTRKVLGGKPGWYDKAAFYERAKKVDEAVDFLKRYEEAGNTAAADRYAVEKAKLLDMEKPVRQARKALSAIRKERAALRQDLDQGRIDRAAYDKEMDVLKADEQAELLAFNADYLSWVGKE